LYRITGLIYLMMGHVVGGYVTPMLIDKVHHVIKTRPGMTAREIAEVLSGLHGYGEQVRAACTELVAGGRVTRQGSGGPGSPYKYYPTAKG
jgi:hypothetical protein